MNTAFSNRLVMQAKSGSRPHLFGIIAVVLIHVAFLYAFITGMAQHFVKVVPHLLEVQLVPHTEQVRPPPPPLPNVEVASVPQVAPPMIRIERAARPHIVTVVHMPKALTPPQQSLPITPSVAPIVPIAPTSAGGVAGTHTIPPYPSVARRLSQEGTVRLRIALDQAGRISAVVVLRSSGHTMLDDAAVRWVKSHWRYHPATRNGQPIPSSTVAQIVFNLKQP